jgi:hypothetical protein
LPRFAQTEIRVTCLTSRDELWVDLWQGLAGAAPLGDALHDRPDAIQEKTLAGLGTAQRESCLLTGRPDLGAGTLARRRLLGKDRSQSNNKRSEDKLISAHRHCSVASDRRC